MRLTSLPFLPFVLYSFRSLHVKCCSVIVDLTLILKDPAVISVRFLPVRMIPTEDASARKREIEDKLKQEQETLSFIRESLEKSDQLTKGM
ncbi:hypothetical protein cypCar_00048104, partial [Cyprinus carpio]